MYKNTKNDYPFFSIILTTFNRGYIISKAIESVINQSFSNWELIIIDDGSIDNTLDIINNYIRKDNRIKYYYQQNKKQSSAKNLGILLSNGIYITFLDSDDRFHIHHLKSRFYMLKNEIIDLLHGGVIIEGNEYVPDMYNNEKLIHLTECVIGGTFFIKNKVFERVGLLDTIEYGDDTNFFYKCLNKKLIIAKTDIKTYFYNRNSSDSICNNIYYEK